MLSRVVKLTKHYGQYRVTLPRELVERAWLKDVEYVKLYTVSPGRIVIEEYHGKGKEKGDLQKNKT